MSEPFRHEALLHAGDDRLVADAVPFVRAGLAAGEPAMVALPAPQLGQVAAALGEDADAVRLVDMEAVGRNPGRMIAAWHDFVAEHAGSARRLRGIGAAVWADRTADELAECRIHEALLNVAFADTAGFHLMCAYDTAALDPDVVAAVDDSHPVVCCDGARRESDTFDLAAIAPGAFAGALPEPAGDVFELRFASGDLGMVRRAAAQYARWAALDDARAEEVVLAVSELASNSVRHGGGRGVLRIWEEPDALVCEFRDAGRIDDPLAGRLRPGPLDARGYGLWLVHQVCDLVQVRAGDDGCVVRVRVGRDPGGAPGA